MSSEFIYASTKVLPYVYKLIHKETGQFYFGVRHANKVPSSEDLGIKYFSSSKYVKVLGFENFNYSIVAEFFKKEDAIAFEKELITSFWGNSESLNKNIGGTFFSFGLKHTDATKSKMSKSRKGKSRPAFSDEWKQNISRARKGKNTGKRSKEFCDKMSQAKMGKSQGPLSEEHKQKLSLAGKNRVKTPEECLNISNSKKGKKIGPWSEERKAAFKEQLKKRKENSSSSL